MVTDTTVEDDLIILSDDDTSTDTLVLEDNENIAPSEAELITFDEEATSMDEKVDTFWESNNEVNNLESFNLEGENETPNEWNELQSLNITEGEDDMDMWVFWEATTDEATTDETNITENPILDMDSLSSQNEPVWTMEDILDRAMVELDLRSDAILKEIELKEANISDLKEQISTLEAQANIEMEEVSELKNEKSMSEKNRKSIEIMKKSNVTSEIKSKTSTKVHNVKRKQAV